MAVLQIEGQRAKGQEKRKMGCTEQIKDKERGFRGIQQSTESFKISAKNLLTG